jgi:hypothetical protein
MEDFACRKDFVGAGFNASTRTFHPVFFSDDGYYAISHRKVTLKDAQEDCGALHLFQMDGTEWWVRESDMNTVPQRSARRRIKSEKSFRKSNGSQPNQTI